MELRIKALPELDAAAIGTRGGRYYVAEARRLWWTVDFANLMQSAREHIDSINLGEDVPRAIESWVGLLGYLMGLIVVTLESRLCKFNAPSNIA